MGLRQVQPQGQREAAGIVPKVRGCVRMYAEDVLDIVGAVVVALLLLVVGVFVVGAPIVSQTMEWHETGGGQHVVIVTAVENEGAVWRTWTAYVKTDAESSQEESYCVRPGDAERLIPLLRAASETRARVVIDFETYLFVDWSECSTGQAAIVGVR